jgi:hypothetical protein
MHKGSERIQFFIRQMKGRHAGRRYAIVDEPAYLFPGACPQAAATGELRRTIRALRFCSMAACTGPCIRFLTLFD